MPKAKK